MDDCDTNEDTAGMSRAAKKRRKKLEKKAHARSVENPEEFIVSTVLDKPAGNQMKKRRSPADAELQHIEASICCILDLREVDVIDSRTRASTLLGKITFPMRLDSFYNSFWQQSFCHFSRDSSNHFDGLYSSLSFKQQISERVNYNGKHIRVLEEPSSADEAPVESEIQVKPKEILEKLKMGYSVQLLCPERDHDRLWQFLSALEHEFQSRVQCTAQLMPPASKGDSRRRSSACSFILQLEGSTIWNLQSADLNSAPVDVQLQPGEALYVPRFWFLQESSCTGKNALFLQLSVNETNNVSDLLELVTPQAVQEVCQALSGKEISLPRGYQSYMGAAYSENDEDSRRQKFCSKLKELLNSALSNAINMLDAGVDQMTKTFLLQRLPVFLSSEEEACSTATIPATAILPFTCLRMLRPGIARAVVEDGMVVVYHCMDNAREMYGGAMQPLEFELDDGPAIEALLHAYPMGITVSELPHPSEEMEDKVGVAQALFKEGILVVVDEATKDSRSSGRKSRESRKSSQESPQDEAEEPEQSETFDDSQDIF